MLKQSKKELIDAWLTKLCAMVAALQNGIENFEGMDALQTDSEDLIDVKEAFSLLGLPEDVLKSNEPDGTRKPIAWDTLPIRVVKSDILSLISEATPC